MLNHIKRNRRRYLLIFGGLAVALGIFRLLLPGIVLRHVNRTLDGVDDYHARIGGIDLALWRGAYTIHDLRLLKRGGLQDVPYVNIPRIHLAVEWKAIFRGKLVCEIEVIRPEVNLVNADSRRNTQLLPGEDIVRQVEKLFPLEINRLRIRDGTVTYRETAGEPPVNLRLTRLEAEFRDITNRPRPGDPLPTTLWLDARIFGQGRLHVNLLAQIQEKPIDFELAVSVQDVNLVNLNHFTRKHAMFDFKTGSFEMYSEVSAKKGSVRGYAKPLFQEVQIVDKKDFDNPLEALWENLVAAFTALFTNNETGYFATVVPIEGHIGDPNLQVWPTLYNIFINAFIKGFRPGLEPDLKPGRQTSMINDSGRRTKAEQ